MSSTTLISSLKAANLLPSRAIPRSFSPNVTLNVNFSSKSVENGTLFRVNELKQQPTISISTTSSTSSQSYTFMLIDPDAPTPDDPKFAYWRHWVVINIPSSASEDVTEKGTTVTQYLAPGPKDESGPHRYLFLVFEEPEGFKIGKEDVGGEEFADRRSFGVDAWVEKWGLKLVGVQWMRGVGDGWVEKKEEL